MYKYILLKIIIYVIIGQEKEQIMKIKEILDKSIKKLKEMKIEDAHSRAKRILAFTLEVKKEYLIIHDLEEVQDEKVKKYNEYIERLINGEPIQYIIGKQEFMGIEFIVNKNVLIPQPDTEILVEKTIEVMKQYTEPRVLDLCTGSGAIAISIAKYVPKSNVFASDISKEALEIAKMNDKEKRVKFIYSNLFGRIRGKYDVIVSNPPYIKTDEIKTLSKEVRKEPQLALDGGQDGLYFYKQIIEHAHNYLIPGGCLCFEIGDDQREKVEHLIKCNEYYENIESYKDLGKNDRVIICKKIRG